MRGAWLVTLALVVSGCRTELNLERGRRYACARDAGALPDGGTDQCSAGYRCGLDGYCFDPDAGEPRACEGLLDCSTGWRCGLQTNGVGTCQAIGVTAAYPCIDDSWCEGGWRCGPGGVCLDATDDALLPPSGRPRAVSRLSPAPLEPLQGLGAGKLAVDGWQAIALGPSAAHVLDVSPRELAAQRLALDGGLFAARIRDTVAIADETGHTHVGALDSQVTMLAPVAFPGFRPTGFGASFGTRRGQRPTPDLLVAWSPAQLAAWDLEGATAATLPAPPGTIAAIDSTERTPDLLVAATSRGVFELTRGGAWVQLPEGNGKCTAAATDVRLLGDRTAPLSVGALYTPADGGAPCAALYGWGDGGLEVAASSVVCEPRSTATGLRLIDDKGTGVWIHCRSASGTLVDEALCLGTTCVSARGSSPSPRELARARSDELDVAIDELGFPVQQRLEDTQRPVFGSSVVAGSLEYDRVISVTRGADGGLELAAHVGGTDAGLFSLVPSLGFARAPQAVTDEAELPLAHVNGSGGLRVLANGEIRGGQSLKPLARFEPIRSLEGDVTAVGRQEGDGGFLYLSSFDALFAGRVDDAAPMALRLVPASRSAITSLAAAPGPVTLSDGGVVQRSGYLVAQGRLFRFESRNRVWRSDEIELPELAVSVWFDGARARVGTSTGRVFGLPTRVPLSEPLPASTATAFTSICGHVFAAAAGGVFRLEAPDAGIAGWRLHDELAAALPRRSGTGAPGEGLRLFTLDDELVVVNADGVVASLTFDCGGSP